MSQSLRPPSAGSDDQLAVDVVQEGKNTKVIIDFTELFLNLY